jgi:hypothetical protein
MFYLDPATQKRHTIGTPFDYDGRQYTKAGATHDKFIELGFTQVIIQQRPDDRFYIVSGPDNDGNYTATPRELEDIDTGETELIAGSEFKVYQRGLKFFYKNQTYEMAEACLQPTDWIINYNEEHPDNGLSEDALKAATDYRIYVEYIDDIRDLLIDACSTVQELEALVKAPVTILDEDGNQVPNPDPYLPPFPPVFTYNYTEQTELYDASTADLRVAYLRARMTVRGIPFDTYGISAGASVGY